MGDLRCALLGSTGMMGQRFIQLLEDHPYFSLDLLFSSARTSGNYYGDIVNWVLEGSIPEDIDRMDLHDFDTDLLRKNEIDIVFSALPNTIQRDMEMEAVERGFPVFSNSATHRMDRNVPILVPEVNGPHLSLISRQERFPDSFIVTNPNCSTSGLVMCLKPLVGFGISRVFVSTYQALSGAGYPGLPSMSIMDNVIPFIKNEEMKMVSESRKILGSTDKDGIVELPVDIFPSCARVPVKDGHLLSVHAELGLEFSMDQVMDAFRSLESLPGLPSAPLEPILVEPEEDRPQPIKDVMAGTPVNGMSVTVGRPRKKDRILSFFALVHNTIRGGAGNAILSAEMACRDKFLGGGRG